MAGLRFDFASITDAADVAALIERAYRGDVAAKGWTHENGLMSGPRTSLAEVDALIRESDSRFVTAWQGSDLKGCAHIKKYGDGAYFGMFAIDPLLQGAGLGKLLLAHSGTAAVEL